MNCYGYNYTYYAEFYSDVAEIQLVNTDMPLIKSTVTLDMADKVIKNVSKPAIA